MDVNNLNQGFMLLLLLILVIWNTPGVRGTTRTINVIVSRAGSVHTFGKLLGAGPHPSTTTDPVHENRSIWEIGESMVGSDYKSSTDLDSLNIIESRVIIVNHYGEETLTLKNCNLTTTPKTCEQSGTTLYFKYIRGTHDLVFVQDQNSFDNAKVGSIVFKHYYSFPVVSNMIVTGDGNLAVNAIQGCRSNGGTMTTVTAASPLTIDTCATACDNNSYAIFSVSPSGCACQNDTTAIGSEESGCSVACTGNADQICGDNSYLSVFLLNEYKTLNTQFEQSMLGAEVLGIINITSNSTTEQLCFSQKSTVLSFTINEEEECYLTNVYFNTTSPGYYIYYGSGTLNNNLQLKNAEYDYEFYPDGDERIDIGSVNTDCIWVTPIAHNYTFHRAVITIYGKTASSYVTAKYMALQLEIMEEESSSTMPSSTVMMSSSSPFDSFITVIAASSLCVSDMSSEIESSSVMDDISSSMMESSSIEVESSSLEVESSSLEESSSSVVEETSSIMSSEVESTTITEESSSMVVESSNDISPSSPVVSSATYGPTTSYDEVSTSLYPTPVESTTITQQAPITPSEPVSSSACSCLCRKNDGKNVTDEDIAQQRVAEIKEKLKVNTEKLSATIRKKISAEDNRPSAQGVGFVGVFFLTLVFSSLILLDVTSICQHISLMKENVRQKKP